MAEYDIKLNQGGVVGTRDQMVTVHTTLVDQLGKLTELVGALDTDWNGKAKDTSIDIFTKWIANETIMLEDLSKLLELVKGYISEMDTVDTTTVF